jgi:ubiquitin-like domain-containing CTD phosphatase 1
MSEIQVEIKWNGQNFVVSNLASTNSVADLKDELAKLTRVLPDRQKLLGLKTNAGGAATNTTLLQDLSLKPNTKIMMMGTVEEKIEDVNKLPENMPEVLDDFDFGVNEVRLEHKEEHLAKIERRVKGKLTAIFIRASY